MIYPEFVCQQLDEAITHEQQLQAKTFHEMQHPSRNRKVSRKDIIKFLIAMEGGSLQAELLKANLDISPTALIKRRKQISSTMLQDTLVRHRRLRHAQPVC